MGKCSSEKLGVGGDGNGDGVIPSRGGGTETGWGFVTVVGIASVKGWKGGAGCSAGSGEVIGVGYGGCAECGGGEAAVKENLIGVAGSVGTCRGKWEGRWQP